MELDEPKSYKEARRSKDISSLAKNNTWILVDRHKSHRVISCKWIFKRKHGILGIEKAR